MKKRVAVILSALGLVGMILIILFYNKQSKITGYEIEFSTFAYETIFKDTKLKYDKYALKEQIGQNSAFIYLNPKLTDYQIVSDFGFDVNDYKLYEDGTRFYKLKGAGGEDKSLKIDPFGCFSYKPGVKSAGGREITLTEKDCMKIAKQYLEKYGLFSKRIGRTWSSNESGTTSKNRYVKTSIGINFFPEQMDGLAIGGNSRISVEINANEEVSRVTYSWREYEKRENVKLISIEEALDRFRKGKAFIEVESPSGQLNFEKVTLAYWTQDRNMENLMMQPIYVFQGTSITTTGETEGFSITVQANAT